MGGGSSIGGLGGVTGLGGSLFGQQTATGGQQAAGALTLSTASNKQSADMLQVCVIYFIVLDICLICMILVVHREHYSKLSLTQFYVLRLCSPLLLVILLCSRTH